MQRLSTRIGSLIFMSGFSTTRFNDNNITVWYYNLVNIPNDGYYILKMQWKGRVRNAFFCCPKTEKSTSLHIHIQQTIKLFFIVIGISSIWLHAYQKKYPIVNEEEKRKFRELFIPGSWRRHHITVIILLRGLSLVQLFYRI